MDKKYDEAEVLRFLTTEHDAVTEGLNEGWMNHKGGSSLFTADMSEIEGHLKGKNPVKCPGCKKPLAFEKFTEKRDRDNDIESWSLTHECGAKLKIFNEAQA